MCLFAAAVVPSYAASETGFLNRSVVVDGTTYRYQVYVPADWTDDRKWPVILFLHGAGERGDDGLVQTEVGMGGASRRHVDRFPAVVVLPQCRKVVWWNNPAMEAQTLAALDRTMQEFHGHTDRVYLTGLSMGGYGAWGWQPSIPINPRRLPLCAAESDGQSGLVFRRILHRTPARIRTQPRPKRWERPQHGYSTAAPTPPCR